MYAPILLFVYNRPWHTLKALEALNNNELANKSVLFIHADGPKRHASEATLRRIEEVRTIIKQKKWCKEVHIIERKENKGLAHSIIDGVTDIVNKYGKVIVLEDDIITSTGFLNYMNGALELYEKEEDVFHISGYMFPVKRKLPSTFFYKQTSCWGWATWKNKWDAFEPSAPELMKKLVQTGKINSANIDGTNQFINQLQANINGTLKTWAVLWHFSVFLKDGLSLHPNKSLVRNIGFDASGTNCGESDFFNSEYVDEILLAPVEITDNKNVYKYLKQFYKSSSNNFHKFKMNAKTLIPSVFKEPIKLLLNKNYRKHQGENKRLRMLPRFYQTETFLFDKKIRIADATSYLFSSNEIFESEIYKFKSLKESPVIIDCGSNIGLSIIYFKKLFPKADILGFEPDRTIFSMLRYNVDAFGFSDVKLIEKACWKEETVLDFFSEGADGGRTTMALDKNKNIIQVDTIRLKNFIYREIDFLKIDIEGAEFVVINDIKEDLHFVNNIFVEYHSIINEEQMLPELLEILKNSGFRLYVSSAGWMTNQPLVNRPSYLGLDNQVNIFGYRD
ncbi:MAG TPA: FkbM family methyltransferase [Parafilimonas sp.]|nr:FkbM family methyltransferase [Parafilimonas sp.]